MNQNQNHQDPNTTRKILLVEDDPVLCKMYTEKFKFEGFEVLVARDGEEGLNLAMNNKVDLILLDIMLPRLSGLDMLEKLRQQSKGADLRVVALTNLAEADEKERALRLGV